ncbi:MAG: amino acid ABC transporter substrate-binding protein [Lacisediminihabitans sp.]
MRIRTFSIAIVAAAAIMLSGCSAGATVPSSGSSTAATGALAAVQKAGVLTIGTEGTYRPFSYHDGGSGKLIGYDVEVAQAVAKKLGVKAKFEETQWDAIFAGLEAHRFDVIANQVSITPEREAKYEFSTPYTFSTGVIVVKSSDDKITSFADLKGVKVAQSLTSSFYTLAQQSGADIQAVEGWAQSIALVQQSRVEATLNDKLTWLDYKKQGKASGLKVAAETADSSKSAFTFAKGSESLVKAVDKALVELSADGTLAKISNKYFGDNVSK